MSPRHSSPGRSSRSLLGKTGHGGTETRRLIGFLFLALAFLPTAARAQSQLLFIPFFGYKFAGHTNIVDPSNPAHPGGLTKATFGGSVDLLTSGFIGVEGDFEHTPHFFDTSVGGLTVQSNVTTLNGNIVFTLPLVLTQESLRPYIASGLGWMHAASQTQAHILDTNSNLLGLDVGGG